MEPDRGYPQAATAHDTFWDFVTLMPESMHMLLWAMSDRTLPRSFRMMEGFGVHTFRFVNADGKSTFVKFHWRPKIGAATLIWDESVKLYGADPDSQRAICSTPSRPAIFRSSSSRCRRSTRRPPAKFPFDVLDATKLIPEEMVPLAPVGRLVLDRNPDKLLRRDRAGRLPSGHVVPGIDFSDDPLLQGRLFSYTDTQLLRLGGANFHELPINRPKCPMANFQRDGMRRMDVPKGTGQLRAEQHRAGRAARKPRARIRVVPRARRRRQGPRAIGDVRRSLQPAALFYRSMSEPEQRHIVNAFTFELSKVSRPNIRQRMLGHLKNIDAICWRGSKRARHGRAGRDDQAGARADRHEAVARAQPRQESAADARRTQDRRARHDGTDPAFVSALRTAVEKAGAKLQVVAPKIGGAKGKGGKLIVPDHQLAGGPSIFFDAVVVAASTEGR
jgi:catalase